MFKDGFGWDDAAALAALVATSLLLAWPILNGGHLTYVDNAVHLAELAELARFDAGWSDIAFTGMPLGTLHSPLWYPLLAAFPRFGVPVEPVYRIALLVGFMAPALALYGVARQRATAFPSLLAAYLILVQAPSIFGVGSALAGMWTQGVGAAGVVVLTHLLSKPHLTARGHLTVAVVLALVALTHLFALMAAGLVLGITVVLAYLRRAEARELGLRFAAAATGAVASASYWLTFVLTVDQNEAPLDVLKLKGLGCRLFLPCDVLYLLDERYDDAIVWDLHLTDAVPLIAVVVLGFIAAAYRRTRRDPLVRAGAWLAAIIIVALLIHPYYPMRWLGPVSWRQLEWVRLGLALAAVPLLDHWLGTRLHRVVRGGVTIALTALGLWWGRPLANDRPAATNVEWAELRRVWDFIRTRRDESWGRLYLLDTFGSDWPSGGLSHSHVLVLTHRETGAPQLGAYYGVVPYRTRWTLSEFRRAFNTRGLSAADLRVMLDKTNSRSVLASTRGVADWLESSGEFDKVFQNGRYAVFLLRNAKGEWVAPLRPSNQVSDVKWQAGLVTFKVTTERPRARLVVKTTWHPWWRLEGIPGAKVVQSPDGFLGITDIPVGTFQVTARYVPSPWPGRVTALGWTILAVWGIGLWISERRRAAVPATT